MVAAREKLQFSDRPEEGDINTQCWWQVDRVMLGVKGPEKGLV